MRVAIQGFGNAGQHIARLFAADGHVIVAVSDTSDAIASADGLDVDQLLAAKKKGQSVMSLVGGSVERIDDVIAQECDLLVPAAPEDMIDDGNADASVPR